MRFVADLPSTDEFTPWCVCAPTRAGEDENVAVFRSDSVVIDRYRARPGGSLWALDRVRTHMLVFPRRFVQIEQAGREPVIASPDRVMFYNAGQEFRRRFVGEPDVNDAFHFPTAVLREALQRVDPALAEGDPIFPIASAPIPAEVYLLQRRVTAGAPAMTELEATEAALRVLDATLRATAGALRGDRPGPRRPRATDAHRDAVDAVIRAIAADPSASHSLDGLAGLAGVSVYHLCRIFRRRTGRTIGRFIHEQRLRRSLEHLADPKTGLTEIALALGYASHSHFTARFGEVFGEPPSAVRRRLVREGRRGVEQLQDSGRAP